jgi:hypothetical protein
MVFMENILKTGSRYILDYGHRSTEVILNSDMSMTRTYIKGSVRRQNTSSIIIDTVTDKQILITWRDDDKTVVTHLADFHESRVVTHITGRIGNFKILRGTITEL